MCIWPQVRRREMQQIKRQNYAVALESLLWSVMHTLMCLTSFATFALLGGDLTVALVFPSLMMFEAFRVPLIQLPGSLSRYFNARSSMARVEQFLSMRDQTAQWGSNCRRVSGRGGVADSDQVGIHFTRAVFRWPVSDWSIFDEEVTTVSSAQNATVNTAAVNGTVASAACDFGPFDLHINAGSIVAVVGKVGAGKTTLLNAILGELGRPVDGDATVTGNVAYCPQLAWIRNATVKENILFGDAEFSE